MRKRALFVLIGLPAVAIAQMHSTAALDTSYHQLGVRPDCSERGLSYDELVGIANSPGVTDQQSFLDKLPADAMQTFTLVYESESAQADGISREFPGVIRMSQDGKLVFRYTCDRRQAEVYDRIEVMRFDDREARFKFSEISFKLPRAERVAENPIECYGCHNLKEDTDDPRPNWAMYPEWPGVFASHDDFFPKGTAAEADLVHHAEGWTPPDRQSEKADFDRFMAAKVRTETPDPCYASLPWPKKGEALPAKFAAYPYDVRNGHARDRIYALRPNLKFTEILSHLLGVRNARRLKRDARFGDLKRLLAVEAGRCLNREYGGKKITDDDLHRYLKEVLRGYSAPDSAAAKAVSLRGQPFTHFDPRHPSSLAQGMYGVSIAIGMAPGDWTLNFGDLDEADYETGAGPGKNRDFPGDLPLTAYVQHEILESVAKDVPALQGLFTRSTGESDDFGPQFACIDRIAGATVFESEEAHAQACASLVGEALDYRARFLARPPTRAPRPMPPPARFPRPFRKGKDDLKEWIKKLREKRKPRSP